MATERVFKRGEATIAGRFDEQRRRIDFYIDNGKGMTGEFEWPYDTLVDYAVMEMDIMSQLSHAGFDLESQEEI